VLVGPESNPRLATALAMTQIIRCEVLQPWQAPTALNNRQTTRCVVLNERDVPWGHFFFVSPSSRRSPASHCEPLLASLIHSLLAPANIP